jgi:pimeloyl-ACP methyl ester carboxylesterase
LWFLDPRAKVDCNVGGAHGKGRQSGATGKKFKFLTMDESIATLELVRIETADGLLLDGSLRRPRRTGQLPVDAFFLIHGTGSNFYAPGVLETFTGQALAAGTAVLRVNTRGHDGVSSIPARSGSRRGGATFERISDCALDVGAWVNWLEARGLARVMLVGHSMGGVKAIYSQAHAPHPSVKGIVAISPPRFAHDRLRSGPRGEAFAAEFSHAMQLVANGQGETLLTVTQPIPFVATAAGYVEKYGSDNRYDYIPLLPRLQCPVLILIGSESIRTSAAFAGSPDAIAATDQQNIVCQIVDGADINYTGCDAIPFQHAADWLRARPATDWDSPGDRAAIC